MTKPSMPDLTQAHILAVLIVALGAVSKVLEAFGVYHLSTEQHDALTAALASLVAIGGLIVAADAVIRKARNEHVAAVSKAEVEAQPVQLIQPEPAPAAPMSTAEIAAEIVTPKTRARARKPKAPPAP